MVQFPMLVLNICPYVGASLYSLHVPSGFSGGAGFDMITNHIFPQALLPSVTLVGGWPGEAWVRAEVRF